MTLNFLNQPIELYYRRTSFGYTTECNYQCVKLGSAVSKPEAIVSWFPCDTNGAGLEPHFENHEYIIIIMA